MQAVEAAMVKDGLVKKGKLPKPYPPVCLSKLWLNVQRQDDCMMSLLQSIYTCAVLQPTSRATQSNALRLTHIVIYCRREVCSQIQWLVSNETG